MYPSTKSTGKLGCSRQADKRLRSWSSTIDHTHNALPLVKPSCLQDYVADEQSVNDAEVYRTHSGWNPFCGKCMKTWGVWHSLCSSWKDGIEVESTKFNRLNSLLLCWSVCCFAAGTTCRNNTENYVGTVKYPIGVIGPLKASIGNSSTRHWR